MICPRRLFTRPKAEREDGAASGWGHSRACPELVEGLPLKLSPNLFVKSPQMYGYVYIIQSLRNNRYYVGSSEDSVRRLNEFHNLGKVKATKFLLPWKLVFIQKFENMTVARKIEWKLKKIKSRVILNRIVETGQCFIKIG